MISTITVYIVLSVICFVLYGFYLYKDAIKIIPSEYIGLKVYVFVIASILETIHLLVV